MDYKHHSGNIAEYTPAFFEIFLKKTANQINLNSCSEIELSAFLHEYIHFLQDLTNTYCLTHIYYHGEYIQSVVNDIRNNAVGGNIRIPYVYDDNKDNIALEETIIAATMGDFRDGCEEQKLENVKVSSDVLENFPFANEMLNSIKTVVLEADNDVLVSFGAYSIKENVAYIIERMISKEYDVSPDYPYRAAEKIAESICPDFAKDLMNVLALCDCSLMFTNPAEIFLDLLYQIRDGKVKIGNPKDLYEIVRRSRISIGDVRTDPFTHFVSIANEARKKLKSYFYVPDHHELHEAYHLLIDRTIDYAIHLRTKNPAFLLDIIRGGYARTNAMLSTIVHWIGTPLMRNKKQEYFSIKPHGQTGYAVEILKSVHQMYLLLHEGEVQCKLFPWCKSTDDYMKAVDKNYVPVYPNPAVCLHNPWERVNCMELCPYALLWRNWGLERYKPVKK